MGPKHPAYDTDYALVTLRCALERCVIERTHIDQSLKDAQQHYANLQRQQEINQSEIASLKATIARLTDG